MDDQQFDDFESAPPLEQPEAPPKEDRPSSVHSLPATTQNITEHEPEKPAIPAQLSVIPHPGSSQTPDVESGNTEQSPEPNLVKKGSDHLGDIFSMEPAIEKTHSLNESNVPSIEESLRLQLIGEDNIQKVESKHTETMSQHLSASQNSSQPQYRQSLDFEGLGNHFNFNQEKSPKPEEKPSNGHQDLLWPQQKTQQKPQPPSHKEQESKPEERKESEQFVYQQSQPRKQSQDFVFQQAEPETRKQSDQFGVFAGSEPRKQSDDFEFQSAEPETLKQTIKQAHTEQKPIQEPEQFEYAETQQEKQQTPPQPQQPRQQEQKFQQAPEENKQEEPVRQEPQTKPQEQEDDEFGDFQQTVQENNVQQAPQEEQQLKVEAQKVPYGQEVAAKQAQLKEFVESLPDYSFLLAEAFLQCS